MAIGSFSPSSPSPDSAIFSAATADESRSAFDGLGIVVGLAAEARLVRRLGAMVETGGGDAEGAGDATARLIARGARCLLSFGFAGGLDPSLPAGALIVPDVVLSAEGHWPTHPPLAAELGRVGGAVFSGGEVVATASAKRALFQRTGAACVDLESAAVAEEAARHAIPFAVLRAVCDPAARALPLAAIMALDPKGRIGAWRVTRAAFAHPGELGALMALGAEALMARRALARRVSTIVRLRQKG
jgi:adenosylhomocysteine nucleosidase